MPALPLGRAPFVAQGHGAGAGSSKSAGGWLELVDSASQEHRVTAMNHINGKRWPFPPLYGLKT